MQLHPAHAPDYLRYSPPDWVRGLSGGTRVAGGALLLIATATVAGEAAGRERAFVACQWLVAAGCICLSYGAWRLGRGDGKSSTRLGDALLRWTLRLATAAGAAGAVAAAAAHSGAAFEKVPALPVAVPAALAADVAGQTLLVWHLRRLALRLPDAHLAKRLTSLVPVYGLALCVAVALRVLPTPSAIDPVRVAGALALAVAALEMFRYLRRLRRSLDIQTDYARGISTRFAPAAT